MVWRDLTWDVSEPTSSLPSCSRHTGLLAFLQTCVYLPPLSLCSLPQECSSQTPFGHLPHLLPTLLRFRHPSWLWWPLSSCYHTTWPPSAPILPGPVLLSCCSCPLYSLCHLLVTGVVCCLFAPERMSTPWGRGRVGPVLCRVLSALLCPLSKCSQLFVQRVGMHVNAGCKLSFQTDSLVLYQNHRIRTRLFGGPQSSPGSFRLSLGSEWEEPRKVVKSAALAG